MGTQEKNVILEDKNERFESEWKARLSRRPKKGVKKFVLDVPCQNKYKI